MNKSNYTIPVFLLLAVSALTSCQKVITLNLQNTPPKYVIEANVTNQPGPYTVTITKSVSFTQDNVYPTVSGATVVITDVTANATDTLKETTPGNYTTSVLVGVPLHQYTLYVNAASNVFKASCTMPGVVTLDSLYSQLSGFRGNSYEIVPVYSDPVALGNYYHFVEVKNDSVMPSIYIRNDQLINGRVINTPLGGSDGGSKINDGDIVEIYLECIDSAIYQYYYGLQQSQNQNSASPADPLSNISGGCLGYFSAHTSSYGTIVIP